MTTRTCNSAALFRYTWPGADEKFVCLDHALGVVEIASAMGLYLQMIPLQDNEKLCQQVVNV